MAYRYGNRDQRMLFPPTIEEYVACDDPVRVYDAFVEALDFQGLGIVLDPCKVGNASCDPKAMVKLLIYGYSYGWRSSRKLERAVRHNVSFMWLIGSLTPDHKTIAEFRRKNKTDRACGRMNSVHGSHAGYNAQLVVDEKHGLIVTADTTDDNNDLGQFDVQLNHAHEVLQKQCTTASADSGYATTERLERIEKSE